ncbi:iron ABC transporter permease [Flavobacterium sp. MXW15]|uniref:Iron ABC transporter permease n=1 Tax=Xanthomonas chitinilytica TaxID=2989819 RepID=A0ABT3JVK1_9XANT|nr:iron ABC transporter permease [Xanthomonas sp. H13-6]MCW4454857.1 iron ABC transporter permease [Flavobacterium sp. MXW15]MCW4472515.1 iron ABC transporter permease [Xanthomonas sp. H13-6]
MNAAQGGLHLFPGERRARASIVLLGAMAACAAVASMGLGHYPLSPAQVLEVLWSALLERPSSQPAMVENVVLSVRLPRVLAAMLVGANLAAAGAAYQTLFRNPLASPGILGVTSGAGFGAALAMLLGGGALAVQGLAFAGGVLAVAAAIFVAGHLGRHSTLVLVLAGLVVSALFQAMTSALKYLADPLDTLPAIVFWLLGSLGRVTLPDLAFAVPFSLLGSVLLFLLRWPTQVMEAGDDEAATLGVPVRRLRLLLIAAATLMTAAAVSLSGVIGWIGLLVPHLARMLVGPGYARLLPASALLGAVFLLLVDDLCRGAFAAELPLGIVTALLGAPLFVALLARSRKRQWS